MSYSETLKNIINNMEKVIVGKRNTIELALIALLSDGHILLEDVPGVGKTTLGKAFAQSIKCGFARIQFTPDTLPGDVTGMTIYNMKTGDFHYSPGVVMNDLLLADEINRTSPKTQASLLEAMEEHQVTVDGTTYPLPELFMVIATQNPVEQLGTYRLPEAQLDRFMIRLSMGYPEKIMEENNIVTHALAGEPLKMLSPVSSKKEILMIKDEIKKLEVHTDIITYAVEIARATRKSHSLTLGASPRAAIALTKAARTRAYLNERSFVTPEDITVLAEPVLTHRLILSPEARLEGKKEKDVLLDILRSVKVPVL